MGNKTLSQMGYADSMYCSGETILFDFTQHD